MSIEISVHVEDQRLREAVAHWIAQGEDLSTAFRSIDSRMNEFFEDRFETSASGTWAELAESTKKKRKRPGGNRGGVNRPLWDTAQLKESLDFGGNPFAIQVIEPRRYERGTRVPYAVFHQTGYTLRTAGERMSLSGARSTISTRHTTSRKRGKGTFAGTRDVPARPIVPDPIPKYLVNDWLETIADHFTGDGGGTE